MTRKQRKRARAEEARARRIYGQAFEHQPTGHMNGPIVLGARAETAYHVRKDGSFKRLPPSEAMRAHDAYRARAGENVPVSGRSDHTALASVDGHRPRPVRSMAREIYGDTSHPEPPADLPAPEPAEPEPDLVGD